MNGSGDFSSPDDVTIIQQWVEVTHSGRRFRLRRPMDVRIFQDQGSWTVRSVSVGVVGYGQTYQEAVEAFQTDFGDCWDRLVMRTEQSSEPDAQEMRERLLDAVDGVDFLE